MLDKYKSSNQFLFPLSRNLASRIRSSFFNKRGVATKEEAEERFSLFPTRRNLFWTHLIKYMKEGGVEIKTGATVVDDISIDKDYKRYLRKT